jgi:SanA protein
MLARIIGILLRVVLWMAMLGVVALVFPRLLTSIYALPRTYSPDRLPAMSERSGRVAIVFGAGLRRDGTPTAVLQDRITTAADLYFAGKVDRLLMSGDNRFLDYNEPGAMRNYALSLGVPDEVIVQDYAGQRTYDTCYRAAHIFGVQQAVVVTQQFHLTRAVYTCNQLGIHTLGVPATQRRYLARSLFLWNLRETLATAVALVDIHITRPLPILGTPEPIFPVEAQ